MPKSKKSTYPADNPEWTPERLARAKPFREMFPNADLTTVQVVPEGSAAHPARMRGPQKAPKKEQIALRLSADVVAGLRATGPGWTGLADELLRAGLKRLRRTAAKNA